MGVILFSIADFRLRKLESINLRDLAHEFGKIFAVARGAIERVEARVHRGFGQGDAV